jgi:hypothetical protein
MLPDGNPENGFASLAHAWSAGVTASLTEHTLGVRRTGPSYVTFDAVPSTGDLSWARGVVPTPLGEIVVAWQRSGSTFTETLVVPDGSRARVGVPLQGPETAVYHNGRVVWERERAMAAGVTSDGRYVYLDLDAGSHRLESTSDSAHFDETGYSVRGHFKSFWERSGGLPVFGYPLSSQSADGEHVEQYFERQRFEHHPENAGTPYEVLLGLLGRRNASDRGLLDSPAFQPAGPNTGSDCRHFPETGHNVCGAFNAYWARHGLEFGDPGVSYRESLALFGFPISEEFVDPDSGLVTQYFERARLEHHPQNAAPYDVLLGRLGAKLIERQATARRQHLPLTP